MSEFSFPSVGGFNAVQCTIEENKIIGAGRSEWPMLAFPLSFNIRYPFKDTGFGFELRELRCRMSPFDGTYIAWTMSIPIPPARVTGEFRNIGDHSINVEIPLDRIRVAALERERKGGDVRLRFDFELIADELVEVKRVASHAGHMAPAWAMKDHHRLCTSAPIIIPRSIWLKQVLPQTGYEKIHIIELPAVPVENCSQLKTAYSALLQAQEMHNQGFYDDAVGKCRLALEPFLRKMKKRKKF